MQRLPVLANNNRIKQCQTLFDSVVVGQYSTNPKEQELIGLSQRMKLSTDEALKLSVFCCCWPSSGY